MGQRILLVGVVLLLVAIRWCLRVEMAQQRCERNCIASGPPVQETLDRTPYQVRQLEPKKKSEPSRAPAASASQERSKLIRLILAQTNAERARTGAGALALNSQLARAAQGHSVNMARRQLMAYGLDGRGPGDRIRAAGYRFSTWSENVAVGQSPQQVVKAWMDSPGHRRNILDPRFTEIGIGIAQGPDARYYYTQNFGRPEGMLQRK